MEYFFLMLVWTVCILYVSELFDHCKIHHKYLGVDSAVV